MHWTQQAQQDKNSSIFSTFLQFLELLKLAGQNKFLVQNQLSVVQFLIIENFMRLLLKGSIILSFLTNATQAKHRVSRNMTEEPIYGKQGQFEGDGFYSESINNIKKNIRQIGDQLLQLEKYQDVQKIYFIGPTGSGKSTLINFLLRNQMEIQQDGLSYKITVKKQKKQKRQPIIGNDGSCTSIPAIYHAEESNMYYVDTAGFGDTSGAQINIINGYAMKQLFQKGQKVVLGILISSDSLTASRGTEISRIIKRMSEMFKQSLSTLSKSIILIITKLDKPIGKAKNHLLKILSQNSQIQSQSKQIIKKIVENDQLMVVPTPENIDESQVQSFEHQLRSITPIELSRDAEISIGLQGQNLLNTLEKQIQDEISSILTKIQDNIHLNFQDLKTSSELDHALENLRAIQLLISQIISEHKSSDDWKKIYPILIKIFTFLQVKQDFQEQMIKIVQEYRFCKALHPNMKSREFEFVGKIRESISLLIRSLGKEYDKLGLSRIEVDYLTQMNQQLMEKIDRITRYYSESNCSIM